MAELIFPNFGNALLAGSSAAYQMGRGRREAEEDRLRKEARQYIDPALKGDQSAFGKLAAGDPAAASSIATMLGRLDATQRAKAKDAAEYTAQGANAILQADPASRPAIYKQIREDGIRRGFNLDSLPPEYNPSMDGMLRSQRAMAIPILEQMKLEQAPTQVDMPGAGGTTPGGPRAAIAGIESAGQPNGGYGAVGPVANDKGSRAYGKYQVMDFNIGPWTQEALGKAMSPQEFLASPEAQDKVFDHKFGQYVAKYGSPAAASRAWFAGEGGMNNPNAKDVLGTTVAGYEKKFTAGMPANSPAPGIPGPVANGPPVQLAQGDGGGQPMQPTTQPKRNGAFFEEDPSQHGYIMQGVKKNGITTPQVIEGGFFVYRDPKGGPSVLYKPQQTPTTPSGYQPVVGGLEAIPGGPADPQVIQRNTEVRRSAAEKAIPQTVTKGMQENVTALKQLDRIESELAKVPDSVGGVGSTIAAIVPGAGNIQNRWGDPEGTQLRALIADVGSMKIHDRSGAAVTASEYPRLRPFIPSISDDAKTVRAKLANFRAEYAALLADTASYYGPENGFKAYTPAVDYLEGRNKGATGTPAAEPSPPPTPSVTTKAAPPTSLKVPPKISEGATATNPQTGERIMFRGGQWVPVQ